MIMTIYNAETGLIRLTIESPDPDTILANVQDGEEIIEGAYDPRTCYIADGEARLFPPRPGPWAQWDGEKWIDPRTPADLEAELQAKRGAAWLTKPDFLLACMGVGLLTPDEAAQAARGIVPEPFQSAVDALDPMTKDYLAVLWPTATRIERTDPFIETIAAMRGLSDALVDQLFGVGAI